MIFLSGVYSLRVLFSLVSWDRVPRPVQRLIMLFHIVDKDTQSIK